MQKKPHTNDGLPGLAPPCHQAPPTLDDTFEELLAFYSAARFLYPAKLAELGDRLGTVRETWERLMAAEDIFKLLRLRREVDERLVVKNSVCAFEYAPGIWQVQHLVSADRHERAGTLAALVTMTESLRSLPNFDAYRLTFRPDNPGTSRLFGELAAVLPHQRSLMSATTYRAIPIRNWPSATTPDPEMLVRPAGDSDVSSVAALYATEHPALPSWMSLDDLGLAELDDRYRVHDLTRRRTVLVAERAGRICGTIACWCSSEGINFSFMENAATDLFVDRDLPAQVRLTVARSLLAAALRVYGSFGRGYAVLMVDDELDRLVASSRFWQDLPAKRYLTLTFSAEGAAPARAHFESYYANAQADRNRHITSPAAGSDVG